MRRETIAYRSVRSRVCAIGRIDGTDVQVRRWRIAEAIADLCSRATPSCACIRITIRELIEAHRACTCMDAMRGIRIQAGVACCAVYGAMDQTARKISVGKLRTAQATVMLVTDVAARGIDIPHVGNVLNYDFPPTPKLFVHRCGRAGRAGRAGTAYSFVTQDDMPYAVDLHLFLSRPLVPVALSSAEATAEEGGAKASRCASLHVAATLGDWGNAVSHRDDVGVVHQAAPEPTTGRHRPATESIAWPCGAQQECACTCVCLDAHYLYLSLTQHLFFCVCLPLHALRIAVGPSFPQHPGYRTARREHAPRVAYTQLH